MWKLAELFVDIKAETKPIEGKLNTLKGQIGGLVTSFKGMAAAAAASFAAIAASKTVGTLSEAVHKAADLNETISKTNEVFGKSTAQVMALADQMFVAFGSNRGEILDAASNIGLIAQGANIAEAESAKLAITMTRLADDAGSFFNKDLAVALEKIRAGLTGESEPLKEFGVLMNEDAVKAEALRIGLVKNSKELTEQTKVMARASLIQQKLVKANGDHARTADGVSNQMKEFKGRIEAMGIAAGQTLLPPLNAVLRILNPLTTAFGNLAGQIYAANMNALNTVKHFAAMVPGASAVAKAFSKLGTPSAPTASPAPTPATPAAPTKTPEETAAEKTADVRKKALEEVRKEEANATNDRLKDQIRLEEAERKRREYHARTDPAVRSAIAKVNSAGGDHATVVMENLRAQLMNLEPERKKLEGTISLIREKAGAAFNLFGAVKGDLQNAAISGLAAAITPRKQTMGGVTDSESYAREIQEGALEAKKTAEETLATNKSMLDELRTISSNTAGKVASNIRSLFQF